MIWLSRLGSLLLAVLGLGALLMVRLDTTWGDRPFDATEALLTAAGLAALGAAVMAWRRPRVAVIGLVLFTGVVGLIALKPTNHYTGVETMAVTPVTGE